MDSNTTAETVFKDFVVRERQEICRSLVVSGNFIMESNSAIFGTVTVISGSVTLGNFSFIKTLYMPNEAKFSLKEKNHVFVILTPPESLFTLARTVNVGLILYKSNQHAILLSFAIYNNLRTRSI